MITTEDIGKRVIIRAADDFYKFINGWVATLEGFNSGHAVVNVPDETVDYGFKQFLVPPDQLDLEK